MIWHKLFDHLSVAVLLLDPQLRIIWNNQSACALLNLTTKQLVGNIFTHVVSKLSIDTEHFYQAIAFKQSFHDNEVECILNNHKVIHLDVMMSFFDDKEQTGLLLELKPIDQQLEHSRQVLELNQLEASKVQVKQFAHEIQNPLGGIRGAAQLLAQQIHDEELNEYIDLILSQVDRLNLLVKRMLGPNQTLKYEYQNIHQIIEKVYKLFTLDNSIPAKIIRDYDPSIPEIKIDAELIEQAVINIVKNALEATDKQGRVIIKTRVCYYKKHLNYLRRSLAVIDVIDNGPGIPEKLQSIIFFPMITNKSQGHGLGLSITQQIIALHQGWIEFESQPSKTKFSLYLPIGEENGECLGS